MPSIRRKELEACLQQVESFALEEANYELEQYPTPPSLAADIMFSIEATHGDFEDKSVLDLGCGGGILGIASCLLGSSSTVGMDIDPKALALVPRPRARACRRRAI